MIRVRIILETIQDKSLLSGEQTQDWGDFAAALRNEAERLSELKFNYTLGFSGVEPTQGEEKE